ncbi:MAG: type I-MYXAN CRISPR-associated protein Cas5/Cmx5/DevS [Thermoguttaceae bacterium]|nr:type I-MYXAN CRISPR-associated protein Cas5/Cmx5/DevS [Thermoguttaceae bacterium]
MLGIHVSVPIACFRKGMAREYLETDLIPPPSTCYGFLLSLVGEPDRERHKGVRISPVLLSQPERSVVLRTVWRVKTRKMPLGSGDNIRPDYQQLLTGIRLIIWFDSSDEEHSRQTTLEERVQTALSPNERHKIDRFGGLSLGESTHLVDEVSLYQPHENLSSEENKEAVILLEDPNGLYTWPVWVDHVGAEKTRYVTGSLIPGGLLPPLLTKMPRIHS